VPKYPFQKWPLHAPVFKSLKTNIWIQTLVFTTRVVKQRMAFTADAVKVQVAWGMVPVGWIPPHRQELDTGTPWLLFLVTWKRVHARVISKTDARKGLFWHWCAQPERPFWRMHATDFWATDARKVCGKSRMRTTYIPDVRATPLTEIHSRQPVPRGPVPLQQKIQKYLGIIFHLLGDMIL